MALPDYMALKEEVGEELERKAKAVVIQRNWPKLEASSEELEDTMAELLDAISKATATELNEGPNKMIAEQKREVNKITTEYLTFWKENVKEIRAIQKIKKQTTENDGTMVRECSSDKKFYLDSSIGSKHLDEDVNLTEINNWIINFKKLQNSRLQCWAFR